MYFQKIGFGFDGTGCGQYAYVPASGDFSYTCLLYTSDAADEL